MDEDDDATPAAAKAPSAAKQMVSSAAAGFCVCDAHGEAWWLRRGDFEALAVDSRAFRDSLMLAYTRSSGLIPASSAVKDATGMIGAAARHSGPRRAIHTRMGGTHEKLYLALYDAEGTVIEIDGEGWRPASAGVFLPPASFQRPASAKALPMPVSGGALAELRPFINVADEDWPLTVSWLLGACMPHGPYPVMILAGEAGAAKTSTARALRRVFDPSAVEDRGAPKDMDAVAATAKASRVVVYDNLSYVSDELADLLCRLATGAGIGKRTLFTDNAESTLRLSRPVLLNGIAELATRGDLASRAITVRAPRLEKYRDERSLNAAFDEAHPRILGALLDAVSASLKGHARVVLKGDAPRMADFAYWVEAAAPTLGWKRGAFLADFAENQRRGKRTVLEGSMIASGLFALALEGFEGTSSGLLAALNTAVPEQRHDRGWPRTAATLSSQIARIADALREQGCTVDRRVVNGSARWRLSMPGVEAPEPRVEKPAL